MYLKNSTVIFLALANLIIYSGCTSHAKKPIQSPKGYDLGSPYKIRLSHELNEISGIAYYPKDTSVFAIDDENGNFYKIYLNRQGFAQKWNFGKKEDFEDIVMRDSVFYILSSKGNIVKLKFIDGAPQKEQQKFPGGDKTDNEFESLYFDENYNQLIMLCKQCEEDKHKISAWGFSPDSATYTPALFALDMDVIAQKAGDEKTKIKPSATAVNPVTNELYIIASVGKLLVIADRQGNVKEVYHLNSHIFKQPEGMAFTPKGDLIISNEAGEEGSPEILIFKRHELGIKN